MSTRIDYEICPECGYANPEKKPACVRCDTRLYSDDAQSHQRYIPIVAAEHRKRILMWYGGWVFVALVLLGPLTLVLAGVHVTTVPGAGAIVAAIVTSWRLVDLKPKMAGSAEFLRRYNNA